MDVHHFPVLAGRMHISSEEQDMNAYTKVSKLNFVGRSLGSGWRNSAWGLRLGIVSASVFMFANVGQAQVTVSPVTFGIGGYGWGGGVGTAESSAEHGYADIIRSEGYYNLATAEGWAYAEQARAQHLRNRQEAYRAYWAGKEQRTAIDAQKRESSRHSAEALKVAAKSALPQPLGPEAVNPVTGKINWPKALLDNRYADRRMEIEKLLELRATTTSHPGNPGKIQVSTDEMTQILKSNIRNMSSTEYMKARKFLDSLAVTAG